MIVILVEANWRHVEEFNIVFECNEEGAIVCHFILWYLLSHVLSPSFRTVAPFPIPFSLTPWISNLKQTVRFTSPIAYFSCTYKWIGMCIYQPKRFHFSLIRISIIFAFRVNCGCHRVLMFLSVNNLLPQEIRVCNLAVQILLRWATTDSWKGFACRASFNSLITTVNLCPSFLN